MLIIPTTKTSNSMADIPATMVAPTAIEGETSEQQLVQERHLAAEASSLVDGEEQEQETGQISQLETTNQHDKDDGNGMSGEKEAPTAATVSKSPEFEPPLSSVTKIIRRAVGDSVQVGKEAKATFTRVAGIFILYITACANDFSREGKRATITANDVYQALKELEFEDMVEPLQEFLRRSNEEKKNKAEIKAIRKREAAEEEVGDSGGEKEVGVCRVTGEWGPGLAGRGGFRWRAGEDKGRGARGWLQGRKTCLKSSRWSSTFV